MSYFSLERLTFPSQDNDINSWADYCELFCVLSENKTQTIDQLKDRLLDQVNRDFKKAAQALSVRNTTTGLYIGKSLMGIDDFDYDEEVDDKYETSEDEIDEMKSSTDSKYDDKLQSEFVFLFDFLKGRMHLFGKKYPFIIEKNKISLVAERDLLQDIYLSMLSSAVLRIYSASDINKLGHIFEDVCGYIFKQLIPNRAVSYYFGTGSQHDNNDLFKGNFYEKVEKLGEAIKTPVTDLFKKNRHDHEHNGDGGLDWVGWLEMNDICSGIPLFFAQCACGKDWMDKEMDAHEDKWNNNLQFYDKYLLYHFISKSFRKNDGEWYTPGKVNKGIILIDRLRFINLIDENIASKVRQHYDELLNEATSFCMPLADLG